MPCCLMSQKRAKIGLEIGQRFAIREGGRTVGAGAITKIAE